MTRTATRAVRGVGWTLVGAGAVILLYVVYLLWFTGLETDRAQRDFAESWSAPVTTEGPDAAGRGEPTTPERDDADDAGDDSGEAGPPEVGEAFAALWFERDGERILHDQELYVVEGAELRDLRAGPGHYPDTAAPGEDGNFAIAGHRTTYGAPFWAVNELQDGDTIHVVDRDRDEWVYAYRQQRIVAPTAMWVIGDDPLDRGEPTITLTTCHPRGSAARRLIVWGELVGGPESGSESGNDEATDTTAEA